MASAGDACSETKQEQSSPREEEAVAPPPDVDVLSLASCSEEKDEVTVMVEESRGQRRQSVGYTSITPREGWQPLRKEKKKKSRRCQTDDELLRPQTRDSTEQSRQKFRSILRHSVTMEDLKRSLPDSAQVMMDLWRRIDHLLRFAETVDSVTAQSLLAEFHSRNIEMDLLPTVFQQQLEAITNSPNEEVEMDRIGELRESIFNWLHLRHAPNPNTKGRLAKRKLIQSSRFDPFQDPDPTLIRFHSDEEGKKGTDCDAKLMIGATPEKLIYFLTTHDTDTHWRMWLLRTSSYYTSSPTEFLTLLIRRFSLTTRQPEDTPSQAAEMKINILHQIDILKSWIKMNTHLVQQNRSTQKLITNLAEHIIFPVSPAAATNLTNYANSIIAKGPGSSVQPLPRHMVFPKTRKLPKSVRSFRDITLNDIHPVEMARQLCLIDQELFQAIRPAEVLHLNWTRDKKHELAPNVMQMIYQFNCVGQWVITQIVTTTKSSRRLKYLERLISVAYECFQMGNFNSAMAVISGLKSSQVTRLKAAWNELPSLSWDQWEEIVEIFKLDDQFAVLREKTLSTPLPNIPYLGMFLSSLTLREGESNYTEEGLINVPKLVYVGSVVEQIQERQKSVFPFHPYPLLQQFLKNLPNLSDIGSECSKPIKRAQSLVMRAGSLSSLSTLSPRQKPIISSNFGDDDDDEPSELSKSGSANEVFEERVVSIERKHSASDVPKPRKRFFFRAFGSTPRRKD